MKKIFLLIISVVIYCSAYSQGEIYLVNKKDTLLFSKLSLSHVHVSFDSLGLNQIYKTKAIGFSNQNSIVISWDSAAQCCDFNKGNVLIVGDTIKAIRYLFREYQKAQDDLELTKTQLMVAVRQYNESQADLQKLLTTVQKVLKQ